MAVDLNIKMIIISCMLCFMASCTHDAPEAPSLGLDIQWDFSVSGVTPTTAMVIAILPEDFDWVWADEDISVGLTEMKPEDPLLIKAADVMYGEYVFGMVHRSDTFPRFFDNLKPNTTYYVVVRVKSVLYDSDDKRYEYIDYYFNGYSFTTPPAGDYSGLFDEIKCMFDGYSINAARLIIILPYGLRLVKDPELRISAFPDMKDFKSYRFEAGSQSVEFVTIDITEKGRYYFEIVGYMEYMDLFNWNGEEIVVKIPNYVDFP